MREDYSKEYGKNYSNKRWENGNHIKPSIRENFLAEGYKFYNSFAKKSKADETRKILEKNCKYAGVILILRSKKNFDHLIFVLEKKSLEERV